MFTLEAIKAAHAKVKSGADFPNYIQDIIKLGVTAYETYVSDSHAIFFGRDNYAVESVGKYALLTIADKSNAVSFIKELKEHQQGKSDYLSFCQSCAKYGVEKWVVNMAVMTCAYYDKAGNEMLVENIPAV
ncbi:DUF1398 domain-containing protein [Ferruginibacter sp. SUN106]|uniref:DUF1398 domain-containing protein n=1 Tax=Ferruginibacter sp. SUN106 TaxID=2978348 RepID=UPI003D369BD8